MGMDDSCRSDSTPAGTPTWRRSDYARIISAAAILRLIVCGSQTPEPVVVEERSPAAVDAERVGDGVVIHVGPAPAGAPPGQR